MTNNNHIIYNIENIFHNFGFKKIKLPLATQSELFNKKLGQQVKSELLTFYDNKNNELALRPEMTSLVVKHFLKQKNVNLPLRLFYKGPVFKENKQIYSQIGTEIIGTNNTYDAENIALAINCIQKLNINNYQINLSNLGIINYIIQNMNTDNAFKNIFFENIKQKKQGISIIRKTIKQQKNKNNNYNKILNILKKLQPNEEKKLLKSLLETIDPNFTHNENNENNEIIQGILDKIKRQNVSSEIEQILLFIEKLFSIKGKDKYNIIPQIKTLLRSQNIPTKYIDELEYILNFLTNYGVPEENIAFDFGMIRNLNYYTGTVFDITYKNITIAKGGRYDKLIYSFNHNYDIPGFGFILELEEIKNITKSKKDKSPKIDLIIYIPNTQTLNNILNTIKILRDNNISIITNTSNNLSNKQINKKNTKEKYTSSILEYNEEKKLYYLSNPKNNTKEIINPKNINHKLLNLFNINI